MSKPLALSTAEVDFLLSPAAIRDRARAIHALAEGGGTHFRLHPEKFQQTVDYVLGVIHKNYPDLRIPFHSRWGHFRAGGIDRAKTLSLKLSALDALEQARVKLDLVVPSVLLDAGAGMGWRYQEKESGKTFSRSEGLGVASFHMFMEGKMSGDRKSLRADAAGLRAVTEADIRSAFQVTEKNPLVGVGGRLQLLNNLASALGNGKIFRAGRPGNILDYLLETQGKKIKAPHILRAVLDGLGSIWPGRISANGRNLGDVWSHSKLGGSDVLSGLVPFHKLSQWMTYSLIEPILEAGVEVTAVDELTGLAEYRNGGLILDSGLVSLRDPELASREWAPESDLVIEWRALTVHYLDEIGAAIQKALGKTPADFPLAKVLEGGTWWAGRFLAADKRSDGGPPLKIKSDGTVF